MKKLVLLFAAALMTGALVTTGGPATAVPYPGTVRTNCHIVVHITDHHISARVWATTYGNAKARGHLTVKVRGKVDRTHTYVYRGGAASRHLGHFPTGHYTVRAHYTPKSGSVFKSCSTRVVHRQVP